MNLSPTDRAKLAAALPVLERLLAETAGPSVKLSRGPDGRHLDQQGIDDLHAAFQAGMTPYAASKHFGIAYRAARLRHDAWTTLNLGQQR